MSKIACYNFMNNEYLNVKCFRNILSLKKVATIETITSLNCSEYTAFYLQYMYISICIFSKIDPQVYLVMINHGAKAEINLPDIKR